MKCGLPVTDFGKGDSLMWGKPKNAENGVTIQIGCVTKRFETPRLEQQKTSTDATTQCEKTFENM